MKRIHLKKDVLFIILMYGMSLFGQEYFTPTSDNIGNSYITGRAQVISTSIVMAVSIMLLILKRNQFLAVNLSLLPFLLLFLYGTTSSIWSPSPTKSAALSALNFTNFVWAVTIGSLVLKIEREKRFEYFLIVWGFICIADYSISAAFKGITPNLDEVSLISFVLAIILFFKFKHLILPLVLIIVGIVGQSVSAILCVVLGLVALLLYRRKRLLAVFLPVACVGIYYFYYALTQGFVTIYGKGINLIATGSGRLNAYEVVWNAIQSSDAVLQIFGHGYATDRVALTSAQLTWTVDVHNNILHLWYGLGYVGLGLFLYACVWTLSRPMQGDAKMYRPFIFVALATFGATSSYFFGRPSNSGTFWMSYILIGTIGYRANNKHR